MIFSKLQAIYHRARSAPSLSSAATTALQHPDKLWAYVRRTGSRAWLKGLFNSAGQYEKLAAELDSADLLAQLRAQLTAKFVNIKGTVRGHAYTPGAMLTRHASILYALIRARRPTTIVETGVCNGFSSAVILSALERNGIGRLYSIDLPEFAGATGLGENFWEGKGGAVVPEGERSGWLVPLHWRDRWTFRLGKAGEQLPVLLDELGVIDLFVHDSEHSYQNQLFEFRSAFEHLRSGGILFASDINWSRAFDVFAKEVRSQSRRFFIDYSLGAILRD